MNLAKSRKRFARYVYHGRNLRDNTLDDAQLETRCPLDNGRHNCTPISTPFTPNQLDKMPVELLVEVLLLLDIPSITRFRSVNRRSMAIVNSIRQYCAIMKHCPNIIRAIISLQADAYDCHRLYATLSTTRCSSPTCARFGNYLYLIDCRRVCYLCFTERLEFFPLTTHELSKALTSDVHLTPKMSARQFLKLANAPSIVSLSGWYGMDRNRRKKGLRLHDRETVVKNLSGRALPNPRTDKHEAEPKRFMAIISAPVLLDAGRQVDWGYFCLGCRNKHKNWDWKTNSNHFRRKYTTEGMTEHIARFGQVEKARMYDRYFHVSRK